MILSEFWEREKVGDVAIHCDTREKARKLLGYFDKLGKTWLSGTRYVKEDFWDPYDKETCYNNVNQYCEIRYYKNKETKIIEFEDVIAYAKVIYKGACYTTYTGWFSKNCPEFIEKYCDELCTEGKKYLILKTGVHSCWNEKKLFALLDEETDKVYLVSENGLKLIKEGEKETMEKIDLKKNPPMWGKMVSKIWFEEAKKGNIYTFRFNEERKSVTLYKDGEKVEFVKCQPEDKFSWKIGLGVALYKHFKKHGKIDAHVEYVKGMVNWKTFYNYIVALAVDFDKGKIERLDARVKRAALYKEIKIND